MTTPAATGERFAPADVAAWREQGFVVLPGFFTEAEIAPLRADYEILYGTTGQGSGVELNKKRPGAFGVTHPAQFKNIDILPYQASSATNLLSLHPALIDFARALLGVPEVRLYQSHTWAKYTGEADYDQGLHCDFGNHTLTVPADEARLRSVDFIVYVTDVTDALGALHYVPKPDSDAVLGAGAITANDREQQRALKARERSAAGPAGTLLAHGIDTFHRGTNLTQPGGYRFTMTIGYKAAGNDMIGFTTWQHAADRPWHLIFNHASPEQLACLGVPLPGDGFWTERTLALTQARWPEWDMRRYFSAAASRASGASSGTPPSASARSRSAAAGTEK